MVSKTSTEVYKLNGIGIIYSLILGLLQLEQV